MCKKLRTPENIEIFVYGLKHNKTKNADTYIIIGCGSDELNENNKLYNFCSHKFVNRQIEMRVFKITGWKFMTLFKGNNFFKIHSVC